MVGSQRSHVELVKQTTLHFAIINWKLYRRTIIKIKKWATAIALKWSKDSSSSKAATLSTRKPLSIPLLSKRSKKQSQLKHKNKNKPSKWARAPVKQMKERLLLRYPSRWQKRPDSFTNTMKEVNFRWRRDWKNAIKFFRSCLTIKIFSRLEKRFKKAIDCCLTYLKGFREIFIIKILVSWSFRAMTSRVVLFLFRKRQTSILSPCSELFNNIDFCKFFRFFPIFSLLARHIVLHIDLLSCVGGKRIECLWHRRCL